MPEQPALSKISPVMGHFASLQNQAPAERMKRKEKCQKQLELSFIRKWNAKRKLWSLHLSC